MAWDNLLGMAALTGLVGLIILIALWPGEKHGRRLLVRWGIDRPSGEDIAYAVRYLKRRRAMYPVVFTVLPVLSSVLEWGQHVTSLAVWTVFLGGLLAELLALRPERGAVRQAALARRTVRDIVPDWALALFVVAVGGGLIEFGRLQLWYEFTSIALCGLVAGVVIAVSVRRPAVGDPLVDLVLRARSARVAAGLAIGMSGTLFASSAPGLAVGSTGLAVLALIAALVVVGPHRSVAATAR